MDLQSFIKSGLLEAYVAGQCTDDERRQVQRMAEQYPEVRAELENIEKALEQFAQAHAVPPPPSLKNKILEQIELEAGQPAADKNLGPAKSNKTWLLFAFAAVCALLSAALYWQLTKQAAQIDQLQVENQALQAQLDDCNNRRKLTEPMAALLRDTDTRSVALTDGKLHHITVFHNKVRQECALDVSGIPVPPTGKYFQAWAIVDGQTIDLGMVQMNAVAGWQPLKYLEGVQSYAISQENDPKGSPRPTVVIAIGDLKAG